MDREEFVARYEVLNDFFDQGLDPFEEETHSKFLQLTGCDFILWTDQSKWNTDNVILSIWEAANGLQRSSWDPEVGLTAFIWTNDDPSFTFLDANSPIWASEA